jgi:hypothetical protein
MVCNFSPNDAGTHAYIGEQSAVPEFPARHHGQLDNGQEAQGVLASRTSIVLVIHSQGEILGPVWSYDPFQEILTSLRANHKGRSKIQVVSPGTHGKVLTNLATCVKSSLG